MNQFNSSASLTISDHEYNHACSLIYQYSGISLGSNKRQMVMSRLSKLLRKAACESIADYLDLVEHSREADAHQVDFINALTTNKTNFFRESHHFDFLRDHIIPQVAHQARPKFTVWSAGCSTGEEPYTIAMTIRDAFPQASATNTQIVATDIDSAVLAHASKGVYSQEAMHEIPTALLHQYFLRGVGGQAGTIVAKPALKELIQFQRLNFVDSAWPIQGKFDMIFCRNVVIYFDRPTQDKLFHRFANYLNPGGYLVLGHSENIHWLSELYQSVGQTVYQLRSDSSALTKVRLQPKPVVAPLPSVVRSQVTSTLPVYNLVLGDVKAINKPGVLKTVLGSCISACLYDPETGIGGMNHFSLPGVRSDDIGARYGAHAMELLITAIMKQGGDRMRLKAKIFGGGSLLRQDSRYFNVGRQNADFVMQFLRDEQIPVVSHFLQPDHGILLRFEPHTGKAAVKALHQSRLKPVISSEEAYTHSITEQVAQPATGMVEFFN